MSSMIDIAIADHICKGILDMYNIHVPTIVVGKPEWRAMMLLSKLIDNNKEDCTTELAMIGLRCPDAEVMITDGNVIGIMVDDTKGFRLAYAREDSTQLCRATWRYIRGTLNAIHYDIYCNDTSDKPPLAYEEWRDATIIAWSQRSGSA